MRDPRDIPTMAELRVEIDALDRELMTLLGRRARLIDRAAELKPGEGLPARTNDRVAAVIANARANAEEHGVDPDVAENLWHILIEAAIAHEEAVMAPTKDT
ncbi:T-protein [Roseivivax sp. THAF40]|uniref:chorismate mutase n=1 Tax=unclassified Roseivivax TaxID=2639302 RepID=UPI001268B165|nr:MULTISPECIES: chorismate mutase [unclassified Roseivivax]QFS81268.1 T-protein [Roseivivax sp. THAF197b]QFT44997.1 T-protein [Roseivivax sp. THAF40]